MGQLSRKHEKNRGERHARRKEARAIYHTMSHGRDAAIRKLVTEAADRYCRERGFDPPFRPGFPDRPVATRWAMTSEERTRLAAYNRRWATAPW